MLEDVRQIVTTLGFSILLCPFLHWHGHKRRVDLFYIVEIDTWFTLTDCTAFNAIQIKKTELWKLHKQLLEQSDLSASV
jgi:hypothetical protein